MTALAAPALVAHQVRYEQKAYWRNPPAAFFTFAMPVMFLVIFATLNAGNHVDFLGGIPYNQYYVPAIATFGVISACYSNLGVSLPFRRDSGILKRLRATPLPTWALLGGQIVNALITALLLVALTLAVGTLGYGLTWHGHLLALLATLVVGAGAFCALGVAVASVIPNADSAGAIVQFALLPITFLSGTFYPIKSSSTIAQAADYLPVRPFTKAVFAVFDPRTTGLGFDGHDLLVLAVWAVAATFFAVRRFRWEPRRS